VVTLLQNGIRAVDGRGNTVANVTTGPDGRYSFTNLLPGDYQVRFTQPGGFIWTTPNVNANADDALDSDALPADRADLTATTAEFTLSSTPVTDADRSPDRRLVTNPTIDAGLVPLVSVGDLVWIDLDRNGSFDIGAEQGIAGVRVELLTPFGGAVTDGLGDVVGAVTTGTDGRYQFDDLVPGTYVVRFGLPNGYVWTLANTGDNGLDSDPIPASPGAATATTAAFLLDSSPVIDSDTSLDARDVTDPTLDAGVVPLLSLGDLVWVDADADGVLDPAELPLEGVLVTLLDGDGNPLTTRDLLGNPIVPVRTDENGRYSFDDLPPGTYRVQFSLPAGFSWSPAGAGNDPSLDSNADAATPFAPTATSGVITLGPTPVADNDPDGLSLTNPTIDAGVVPVLSLGDLVWVDEDRDGIYDPVTERPLPGVTVSLTDVNGDPVLDASGVQVADVTTGTNGRYFFTNLDPGTYVVTFELPAGHIWTTDNQGTDDSLDSDPLPLGGAPEAATATTRPIVLTPAGVADNDPDGLAVTNPTVDAGVVPVLSLGDAVWIDTDNDGVYDANEVGLGGVTVTLRDATGNAVTDAFGNPIGPVTTDPDGRYQFDGLLPGDYQITFTLPSGYAWSPANAGGDDGRDSDVTSGRTATSGTTAVFTLSSVPVTDSDPSPDRRPVTNPTLDAGVVPLLSAGDFVWSDNDGDGIFDPGEPPLAGVPVRLLDAAGNPARDAFGNVVPPVVTDANGRYQFDNLPPGDYQIEFTLIGGFAWTSPNVGGDDSLDSDAISGAPTASTARTAVFSLTPSPVADSDPSASRRPVTNPTLDAGLRPVLSLGDFVWYDLDADGVLDPGEPPAPGVTVTLRTADGQPARDATGAVVPSTTTDANGRYSFNNLVSGTYVVVFDLPAGSIWSPADAGGNDALDSDVIASSPRSATAATAPFLLVPTPVTDADPSPTRQLVTNPTIDAGIIPLVAVGDVVWRDLDHDGLQDAGEPGVGGITVTLLDGNGNPARDALGNVVPPVTTGPNGGYVFTDLLPGTYSIQFGTPPPGFEFTFQGQGGPNDSNPGANGRTPPFTLIPGDPDLRPVGPGDPTSSATFYNPTIDAGIYAPLVDGLPPTSSAAPGTTQPIVRLPSTGSEVGDLLALAAIAMLVGGALVLTTRRRRPNIR
jgi:LPXTG-motif cell wall-anchored protein